MTVNLIVAKELPHLLVQLKLSNYIPQVCPPVASEWLVAFPSLHLHHLYYLGCVYRTGTVLVLKI